MSDILPLSTFAHGQKRAVTLLCRAHTAGRLAHGILMVGPLSTPVAPMCWALAGTLLCQAPVPGPTHLGHDIILDACGRCVSCVGLAARSHGCLTVLEGNERGTITVDAVRAATRKLHMRPPSLGRNILYIDGADKLLVSAQNALLKTLEEPPGQGLIILGALCTGRLLPTILSRVLRVRLAPSGQRQGIRALLQAGIDEPYAALLAPQVGEDVALGQKLLQAGFVAVHTLLQEALQRGLPVHKSQGFAATLAQNPAHFDMALMMLEIMLRDALAHLGGASQPLMTQPGVNNVLEQLSAAKLSDGIDQLMTLRRLRKVNINRAQALEGLFVTLNHRGSPTA